jgi:DNA-binding transcriptional regulator YhcF (GntR family)
MSKIFEYISIDPINKSKKQAIVNGILEAIDKNDLQKGDPLPSVNKFIQTLGVARMTVVKALNTLKERGIIVSEDKIGYYVRDVNVKRELKVFLFLTGFYSYHETLYNSIIENIQGQDITIDLYFHHCNPKIFRAILNENLGSYGLYVITGMEDPQIKSTLNRIPPKKLLQIIRPPLLNDVSSISQDFYMGVKKSLNKLKTRLVRYQKFILVFAERRGHPETIKIAFTEFCAEEGIEHSIEKKLIRDLIHAGTAFFVIEDNDLISLIKLGEEKGLKIGHDLGILSYNETPMKEIIRNGITVISVDFKRIGHLIAKFIQNPKTTKEIFYPEVIIRESL